MAGRYDRAERKRAQRAARHRGCFVYIAAEELERAGIDPYGEQPWYTAQGARGGTVFIRLYREK